MALLVSHPDEVKLVSSRFGKGATSIDTYLALDCYTHSLVAFRVTLVSEKPVDIAMLLRDVMTPHPMVIRPADSLAEAMRRLLQGHRRHLPVVDERGRVLGLLSIRDILVHIASRFPEDIVNLPPNPDHES